MIIMNFFLLLVKFLIFLLQEPELDTELDPVETYNFFLILLGVILLIIILVYILMTSKEDWNYTLIFILQKQLLLYHYALKYNLLLNVSY